MGGQRTLFRTVIFSTLLLVSVFTAIVFFTGFAVANEGGITAESDYIQSGDNATFTISDGDNPDDVVVGFYSDREPIVEDSTQNFTTGSDQDTFTVGDTPLADTDGDGTIAEDEVSVYQVETSWYLTLDGVNPETGEVFVNTDKHRYGSGVDMSITYDYYPESNTGIDVDGETETAISTANEAANLDDDDLQIEAGDTVTAAYWDESTNDFQTADLTVDDTSPTATLNSVSYPNDGSSTGSNEDVIINYDATDNAGIESVDVRIFDDDGEIVEKAGTSTGEDQEVILTIPENSANGNYDVEVEVTDLAGNSDTDTSQAAVTVDNAIKSVSVNHTRSDGTAVVTGEATSTDYDISFEITDETNSDTVTKSISSTSFETSVDLSSLAFTPEEGDVTLRADQADSYDTEDASTTFEVDDTDPDVASVKKESLTSITVTLHDDGSGLNPDTIERSDFSLDSGSDDQISEIDESIESGDSSGTVSITLDSAVDTETMEVSVAGIEDLVGNEISGSGDAENMDGVAPAITGATLEDATDENGIVTHGDTVTVYATVTDGTGVDSVEADLSDFGVSESTTLHPEDDGQDGEDWNDDDAEDGSVYGATVSVTMDSKEETTGNSATITAIDSANEANEETTDAFGDLEVDNLSPKLTADSPTAGPGGAIKIEWTLDSNPDDDEFTIFKKDTGAEDFSELATNVGDSLYLDSNTDDGAEYEYRVEAADDAGNTNESNVVSATADSTPPSIDQLSADSGTYAEDDTVDITATFSETVSYDNGDGTDGLVLRITDLGSGGPTEAVYGEQTDADDDQIVFEYTVRDGDDGALETVGDDAVSLAGDESLTDDAGNSADFSEANGHTLTDVIADAVAPSVSAVELTDDRGNAAISFDATEELLAITVSVEDPDDETLVTLDEGSFSSNQDGGNYTYTLDTIEPYDGGDGEYEASVDDAIDAADNNGGNDGEGSERTDTYTLDTTVPSVSIDRPTDGNITESRDTIEGSTTDNIGVKSVNLTIQRTSDGRYWNGSSWQPTEANISTSASDGAFDSDEEPWNYSTSSITAEDTYKVIATAFDIEDNENESAASYTIDTTAPTVSISDPSDGDTVRSQGTIEGSVTDDVEVRSTNLTIQRESDGGYWNGSSWGANETNVSASASDGAFDSDEERWSYDSSDLDADDTYNVTVIPIDAVGNTTNSSTVSYTIHTPSSSSSGSSSDDEPSVSLKTSDDGTVMATGSATADEPLEIDLDETVADEASRTRFGRVNLTFAQDSDFSFEARSTAPDELPDDVSPIGDGGENGGNDGLDNDRESGAGDRALSYAEFTVSSGGTDASDRLSSATVRFDVDAAELEERDFEADEVALHRYDAAEGTWDELETTVVDAGDDRVVYETTTPVFSVFAVGEWAETGGESDGTPTPDSPDATSTPDDSTSTTEPAPPNSSTTDPGTETTNGDGPGFGIIAALIALVVAGIFVARRRMH